jgi:mannose-6-phosphate isomerase-like protein (cupin superfamily)
MANAPIDLAEKLSSFTDHWSPKVVARLNDYEIRVVKVQGEFVWHTHDDTDELFLVLDGELTIQLLDGNVALRQGQLFVVPRGAEHRPIAAGEVHAILMEPVGVLGHRKCWRPSHSDVRRLTGIVTAAPIADHPKRRWHLHAYRDPRRGSGGLAGARLGGEMVI